MFENIFVLVPTKAVIMEGFDYIYYLIGLLYLQELEKKFKKDPEQLEAKKDDLNNKYALQMVSQII